MTFSADDKPSDPPPEAAGDEACALPAAVQPPALSGEPPHLSDESPAAEPLSCWRCERLVVPAGSRCPACAALLLRAPPPPAERSPRRRREESEPSGLGAVGVTYGLFLFSSVVWGWVILANGARMTAAALLAGTVVFEGIDTSLVLASLALIGFVQMAGRRRWPGLAWGLAVPVLALLLGLNFLYFETLRSVLKLGQDTAEPLTAMTLLIVCIQPAIVEELFFRQMAFGVFHRACGATTTVWVTSVMFAMAHIYNPLGTPYLFVAGLVFGVARLHGGLLLPMVMHFLHNLALTAWEAAQ